MRAPSRLVLGLAVFMSFGAMCESKKAPLCPNDSCDHGSGETLRNCPQDCSALPVGTMPGRFAVSDAGDATYTIPLEIPPAANGGIQPELALRYSSSQGNGYLGADD